MLRAASAISDLPARIDFISGQFLGVPYGESTLVGSPDEPEVLVIDLRAVDCFTYVDYVESMRLSRSLDELKHHLRMVRYRSGAVAYKKRHHFFTDWAGSGRVEDVTRRIGLEKTRTLTKHLNRRADGSYFLPEIPPVERRIGFVPAEALDRAAQGRLQTGDYLGMYAQAEGLDVSHVGIVIRREGRIMLRHASSLERRVVEQDLDLALEGKPGIVVLRPVPLS